MELTSTNKPMIFTHTTCLAAPFFGGVNSSVFRVHCTVLEQHRPTTIWFPLAGLVAVGGRFVNRFPRALRCVVVAGLRWL